jgi:hypothetical protein
VSSLSIERASAFLLGILEGVGTILILTFIGSTWVSHTTLVSCECGALVGGGVQSSNEPISFPPSRYGSIVAEGFYGLAGGGGGGAALIINCNVLVVV